MPRIPDGPRTCTVCQQTLPMESFYVKDKRSGRRFAWCKACHTKACQARYNARTGKTDDVDRRTIKAPFQTERRCTKCGEVKLRDAFPLTGNGSGRLRSWCIVCKNADKATYRAAHIDEIRAKANVYYREHRDECLARYHSWRATRVEHAADVAKRSKTKHQERVLRYNSEWRKKNLALCNTYWSKRRARLVGNGGSHTVAEWQALLDFYGHRCLICGRTDVQLTKDHVVPVSRGGTDSITNLQPACKPCNSSKGDRIQDYRMR